MMKYRMKSFFGGAVMTMLALNSVFGIDIPPEVWKLGDMALSNSTQVCISAEKLKADYKVLEAKETEYKGIYKVADFPKRGIHAEVTYLLDSFNTGNPYQAVGEMPSDEEKIKGWNALLLEKKKNFPKLFPATVVCMDDKAGRRTRYEFNRKGMLLTYSESVDDSKKQGVFMQFHENRRLSNFVRNTKGGRIGLQYLFDKEGNLIQTDDHGPAATDQRVWEEIMKRLEDGEVEDD